MKEVLFDWKISCVQCFCICELLNDLLVRPDYECFASISILSHMRSKDVYSACFLFPLEIMKEDIGINFLDYIFYHA